MDMQRRPPISLPFYYGWFVVGLCFLTTITSAGVRSSPQVLILPLQEEFGWSRALIAMAISMNLLLFGVAAPISGYLIDRYGPRKIMLASLSLLIVGVICTIAMDQFWQFFLVWGIIVESAPAGLALFSPPQWGIAGSSRGAVSHWAFSAAQARRASLFFCRFSWR